MSMMRSLLLAHRRAMLALMLAALGVIGVLPAGTMLAPGGAQGAAVILCPQTHPLARALAARPAAAPDAVRAAEQMAALHAAMGHGPADGGAHHHGDHQLAADHTAMGQHGPAPHDPAPDPHSSAAPAQSCAFASLALAGILSQHSEALSARPAPLPEPLALPPGLRLVAPAHLRPPLRAPPHLI